MEFTTFIEFLKQYGGPVFAMIGCALAVALPGIGSATGVGIAGESAAAVVAEDSSKYVKTIILQALPGTQGFYGLITAMLVFIRKGLFAGTFMTMDLSTGMLLFAACLPIALVGRGSAIAQGKVAAAGIALIGKKEEELSKAMVYAAIVETYAILALAISVIILLFI
ncbi:MAG: V-type ATP synthase subunit K [Clostridiaceae bacterium]